MADETNWIFLEDAPEDLRGNTLLRHHLRNRDEMFDALSQPHMDYLCKAGIVDDNGNFITRRVDKYAVRDPGHVSAEHKAVTDRNHAEAFVQKLLKAVPVDQRITMAAPTRLLDKRGGSRSIEFDARHPVLTERHAPWVNARDRKFQEVAATLGRSQEYASKIKAELKLIYLVAGQVPPFEAAISDSRIPAEEHENTYSAVITGQLYPIHEAAMSAALERGMHQTIPPIMNRHAELLCRLFVAMTVMKIGPSSIVPIRAYFRTLREVVSACRAESQQ